MKYDGEDSTDGQRIWKATAEQAGLLTRGKAIEILWDNTKMVPARMETKDRIIVTLDTIDHFFERQLPEVDEDEIQAQAAAVRLLASIGAASDIPNSDGKTVDMMLAAGGDDDRDKPLQKALEEGKKLFSTDLRTLASKGELAVVQAQIRRGKNADADTSETVCHCLRVSQWPLVQNLWSLF